MIHNLTNCTKILFSFPELIYFLALAWLCGVPERALKEELSKREAAQWLEENRAAIRSYNAFVEQHGCFDDEFREF